MSWKPGEITSKLLLPLTLLGGSAFFFLQSGYVDAFIVPGVLFGAGGIVLALRRDRRPELTPDLLQRVDQLAQGLSSTQAELASTQEEVQRLREASDFMSQLRAPAGQPALPTASTTPPRAG